MTKNNKFNINEIRNQKNSPKYILSTLVSKLHKKPIDWFFGLSESKTKKKKITKISVTSKKL